MMAFGRDQILKKDEIDTVVSYVRSLSDPAVAKDLPMAKIEACKGSSSLTVSSVMATTPRAKPISVAPNLTDKFLDQWR